MTPADVLLSLVDAGVVLRVEGDALRFRGPRGALTAELRAAAGVCRTALIGLERAGAVLPDATGDWRVADRENWEERAGILEFDGGLPRTTAEREAERLVRLAHARAFVRRNALVNSVLPPDADAVACNRPRGGPNRGP